MVDSARPRARAFSGIRARLLGLILVAVLPLIAAMGVALYRDRANEIDAAGRRVEELAHRVAVRYREVVLEAQTLVEIAAFVPEVTNGSAETCRRFLADTVRNRPLADGLSVLDAEGRMVCTTLTGALGIDFSDRTYFRTAKAERRLVTSDFLISRVNREPISVVILPLVDDKGRVTRLISMSLKLDWFTQLAAAVAPAADATFWLAAADGTVMARIPQPAAAATAGGTPDRLPAALRAGQGWMEAEGSDGTPRLYGVLELTDTGSRVAVGIDRAHALAHVDARIGRALLIVAVALLVAIMMGLAMARRIADPLTALTAGAEAARRSSATSLPVVGGYAEIDSLSRSLAALLGEARQREEALVTARREAEQASEEARAAHARLREAIEAVPVGLAFFDADDRFVLWNKLYEELYGGHPMPIQVGDRLEDRLRARIERGLVADAHGREGTWLAERMAKFRAHAGSHEQQLFGDRWLRVEERRTSDGGSIGIRIDITELKRSEQSFRLLFDANPVPMWVFDRETLRFLAVNDAAIKHYGYSREQFLAMTLLDIRDPVDHHDVSIAARSEHASRGERVWRHRRADGSEILIQAYTRVLTHEGRPAKLGALIDITQRWHDEARIRHLAHYDGLTELANRTLFRARLEQALRRGRSVDDGIALICLDLDGFKDVNDTLGHPIGDELLKRIGLRLRQCVRPQDTAARIGGDEFAVVQDGIASKEDARRLAEHLIAAISAPYVIDSHEITVTPSVGIATTLDDAGGVDELLNHADMALYRAKTRGRRSHCFFAPEMDAELKARRTLETQLRIAFEKGQFEVHYQPWVDLADNRISGFEALLRWTHPERGAVSPAEFIPIAEATGLIVPLGDWVLRRACEDAARWPQPIKLAVNLSPVQFRSGDIVESVRAVMLRSGLDPARIELEITETVLLEDNASNLATLHALRRLGVRIAMDDFGTGYSSLGYLRRFPFDKIKIDRSFVSELPGNPDCLTITRGVADLAAGLGMTTIAEGVETTGQQDILRAIGCTHGQGYLFGRAMTATAAADRLAGDRRIAAA
ncbi:putative signaling protein [Rhodoplanes serenus]|uniref:Signaling protein n=1 Tax=Rhodoplanes serenus TaxID=200615 RepID=A0A447CPT3_9BRAD|nr:putative signaling protein [Rhodoplanes serenus]